ncbi:MAG TPA: hypothetical protein PLC47_10110, partial [Bacteroidales bacterium]|nr:hypothetical protein [Bacteroidales bacterium]
DTNKRNFNQSTFGIFTAIGDVRQGADKNKGEFHESIGGLGALMSAGLLGIDKTNQHGYNFVKMAQNYFNSDNGWNIVMNNTNPEVAMLGGGYGRDWWYDVYPNLLYYAVSYLFPDVDHADSLLQIIANQVLSADQVLNGNYHYSYFDYSTMKGMRNHIPYQEDAAAGHAWILLSAYNKFGDEAYIKGAISAMHALDSQTESRFYEVLLPFGVYTAARLNAEHNQDFDLTKIFNWTFDGTTSETGRLGWGVNQDKWGEYDVSGLVGSWHHDGGFAFAMNTFDMAWPLVPMVRYAPQYSNMVGKWMLNAANAARLFYPHEIPDENQWLPEKKAISRNVIAYEGLKKTTHIPKPGLEGTSPVALGDGPLWLEGQPDVSMFGIYGSAHAGIFGAIIQPTNVEGILKLDCLATDFYNAEAYPTFLLYNPYTEDKTVSYHTIASSHTQLFDVITQKIMAETDTNTIELVIPARSSRLVVEIPKNIKLKMKDGKVLANDIIIAY